MLGLSTLRKFRRDAIGFLQCLAEEHGDIATFKLGPMRAVLVNSPELIREVLVTQKDRFPRLGRQLKTVRSIDGNSLFVKEGQSWLSDRRIIQAAFQPQKLEKFAIDVLQQTHDRVSNWIDGQTIEFCDETADLAILIAGKTILGLDVQSDVARLRKNMHDRSDVFVREMAAAVRLSDDWPLPTKRKKKQVIQIMDQLIYGAISQRRESPRAGNDLLSSLLEQSAETGMSDQQIRDHINMLFQAGLDDMATAMVWMFYLIASHPEIQARLQQEIAQTTGGAPIQPSDWSKFAFAQQVVNETLRLYPSTWMFTARKSVGDNEIGGFSIKHRTWVFISPYVTQRDSRYFENPTCFDPDRFADGRLSKIQQQAFFPFGMGPRACAGNRFSMMELVLVAVSVLQRFDLQLSSGQAGLRPVPKVTVRPNGSIEIIVKAR